MHCFRNSALLAVFTSLTILAFASSALPQFKPNRSDQDPNAIGNRNSGNGVNFFSREKELALGKQLAQEVERSSKMIDDPIASEYLNRIVQNIAKNSDAEFPVNVRIIDSNEINAFTLPGGYQYVNRGLILATNSEAELAGVLAYAVAHTALRTGTRQATKGELTQLSSIPAMIFTSYTWASYGMYQGLNLAIPLTSLKFSREAVSAADFYAVQYLYKTAYNAEAYPQLLERALQKPPKSQNIPKAFSTHPALPERVKAIREEIARLLPQRPDETVSSPDFEVVKERLRAWQPQNPGVSAERPTDSTPDLTNVTTANLIDDLVDIDAQAPGLHSTALVRTFIADNSPSEFAGGVIGSVAPKIFPQMTELVRRGVSSLPLLIQHLDDKRPTKLTVGGDFFMFRYFSDEYDSKTAAHREGRARLEKNFDGKYTVRVSDVCYALIGQIVNRDLLPIRYQPTAGLVVNSPIEAPVLIEEVQRDWGRIDSRGHEASLLADARAGSDLWKYGPALRRLRFYYPDEYRKQAVGALKEKIRKFESTEKNRK